MSQYHIVQIGCGVVGKAYVDAYKSKGCQVTVIEASNKLVDLYCGEMKIFHIFDNLESIKNVDFIMISVCTPLNGNKLDMSYLFSSIANVKAILENSPDAHVVIRSTVPPTTTVKYKKELEKACGKNVKVAFQPEFLRAVSARDDALNPWHIVLGVEEKSSKLLELYTKFLSKDKITIMSIEEAELLKLFHNCYNAAKISLFNQYNMLCESINEKDKTDIKIDRITEALSKTCEGLINPKYGTKAGHAYYGTCLPKDSAELASLEKQYNLNVKLFDSVVKVNDIVKKRDSKEFLSGDFHMKFNTLNF